MPIRFGTDGWRAVISDEFTFENVRHVALAIADYVLETRGASQAPLVIGFDTRFLSDRYAREVARVLADTGLTVYLSTSDCPTPALAYAIRHLGALGGVMITASHNPPRYNGIKFKAHHTGPALPDETRRIEEILERNLANGRVSAATKWALSNSDADYPGIIRFDPMPPYLAHLHTLVDFQAISASHLRVVVDPMYGAGRGYIAAFLREAGCEVTELHSVMNPGFGGIHPEPIERNLGDLVTTMRSGQYDLGLATDGDADRIGAVDALGYFVDPHRIFSLILRHLVEEKHGHGAVVKTVSTTQLLNKLSQHYGLPLYETPVGFNHICALMLKEDALMGGEESGGMTIKGHVLDGDGILMGLLLTELLAYQRKPLHQMIAELMDEFGHFYYGRDDVHTQTFDKRELTQRLTAEAPERILHHKVVQVNNSDGIKYLLDDDSWLLIRPSGTEPLLRIYAEARDHREVQPLLAAGARLAHV
ncbi:MAG: phosphoglucomutase/phosphomannomutase family protein [Anaerolineae bacterium]